MTKYPIFLDLSDKNALITGAGKVAARKAVALLETAASVTIVGRNISTAVEKMRGSSGLKIIKAPYSPDYLDSVAIVIAATDDHRLNEKVYADCRRAGILCNVVDEPQYCDFYVPAVVRRGSLQIAISTDGSCPAYSAHLRKKLEKMFTDQNGEFLEELKWCREKILEKTESPAARKAILEEMASDESFNYYKENGSALWRDRAEKRIKQETA